jgi:hypothetical protein
MIGWFIVEVAKDKVSDVAEKLRHLSLMNAKQLLFGPVANEVVLHVQSNTLEDLNVALGKFASQAGVVNVSLVRAHRV